MRVDPEMEVSDAVVFREGMNIAKLRGKGNKVQNWVPLILR